MAKLRRFSSVIILSLFVLFSSYASYAQENITSNKSINHEETDQIFSSQVNSDDEMAILVKENKRCIRCHKKQRLLKDIEPIKSVGAHTSRKFYNNCTACHGNKGAHPRDNASIISFSEHSNISALSQNEQCLTCHLPKDLRQTEWTHDVHYKQINCASCHSLHTDVDPVIGIEEKSRIQLCIDCHTEDQALEGDQ
ncbi:cytochrome c3 family protein [Photobacterium lipolyticum]|uniref:Cytochrome C n=1 Tax=Photobacterium lipolyticum TaxID=266810 RepID=A0A2T3N075_9GAMM|nr:cytochrome c3 family protein [Photobacterium lipolyticum]PSW05610.1 cytochrome C [Photobacterium lipolyticum]